MELRKAAAGVAAAMFALTAVLGLARFILMMKAQCFWNQYTTEEGVTGDYAAFARTGNLCHAGLWTQTIISSFVGWGLQVSICNAIGAFVDNGLFYVVMMVITGGFSLGMLAIAVGFLATNVHPWYFYALPCAAMVALGGVATYICLAGFRDTGHKRNAGDYVPVDGDTGDERSASVQP
jgi:hypothetical protein